jgi:hypothetical protein
LTLPACTTVQRKIAVLSPISVGTTHGRPVLGSAPATVVPRLPRRAA